MKFWITDESNEEFESFETSGHSNTNLSAHLDAMKIASSFQYSSHAGFYLHTEDGFIYAVVDPHMDSDWCDLIAFDHGVLIERSA